jgi:hypothetical protein
MSQVFLTPPACAGGAFSVAQGNMPFGQIAWRIAVIAAISIARLRIAAGVKPRIAVLLSIFGVAVMRELIRDFSPPPYWLARNWRAMGEA